jgi:hypothetical protein
VGGSRQALIVATATYEDPGLRRLRTPATDAIALGSVLSDPAIGDFAVEQVVDEPHHKVGRALERFFARRSLDDVLLVHLSCHGLKDDDGRLYFAATDTERLFPASTAIRSDFLNDLMEHCRARSIVLMLDCCYSGAVVRGSKGDETVHLKEKLSGHGRAILTATNATEYAWEGSDLVGGGEGSVFTSAIVEGLRTGAADRDGDGLVSIGDLYGYVEEKVRAERRGQHPRMWAFDIQENLYLAHSPRRLVKEPVALPSELEDAMRHMLPRVRAAAAEELAGLLDSRRSGVANAALQALQQMAAEDDSYTVRSAAQSVLERVQQQPDSQNPTEAVHPLGNSPQAVLREQVAKPRSPRETSAAAELPTTEGADAFEETITASKEQHRPGLRRMLAWARDLEAGGLARLMSVQGKYWPVLRIYVPGEMSLVVLYNDRGTGARLSAFRSVFERLASNEMQRLEAVMRKPLSQGGYIPTDDSVLEIVRDAYRTAAGASTDLEQRPAEFESSASSPADLPTTDGAGQTAVAQARKRPSHARERRASRWTEPEFLTHVETFESRARPVAERILAWVHARGDLVILGNDGLTYPQLSCRLATDQPSLLTLYGDNLEGSPLVGIPFKVIASRAPYVSDRELRETLLNSLRPLVDWAKGDPPPTLYVGWPRLTEDAILERLLELVGNYIDRMKAGT